MGSITVRLSDELHEQLKERATALGQSVSALVISRLTASEIAPVVSGAVAGPDPRIATLAAEVATLTEALVKSRKVAQSLMPMADRKPERGSGKIVADVLPVAGDQFPKQLTWWQKQQATKAKGKAG